MSVVAMLPPLLMFFFAQRYFIQGIVISGVKG
jgi:multiple sugar transport system permease protein